MGQTLSAIIKYLFSGKKKYFTKGPISTFDTPRDQLNSTPLLQHEHIAIDISELNDYDDGDDDLDDENDDGGDDDDIDGADIDDGSDEVEEEENELSLKREVVVIIWKNHYNNFQKILLVGEGDFSFSNSLAMVFGSATNMIATSLDSQAFLARNYINAMSNIQNLTKRGCMVMHGVNATQMVNYIWLLGYKFDRIIYNFPHAGFFNDEPQSSQLSRHRTLVRMFMINASQMIAEGGEIHITHKSNKFFREWNLGRLALESGLRLFEEEHFNYTDYPGYRTKYGFGGNKNFNCNPSKTYKFTIATY